MNEFEDERYEDDDEETLNEIFDKVEEDGATEVDVDLGGYQFIVHSPDEPDDATGCDYLLAGVTKAHGESTGVGEGSLGVVFCFDNIVKFLGDDVIERDELIRRLAIELRTLADFFERDSRNLADYGKGKVDLMDEMKQALHELADQSAYCEASDDFNPADSSGGNFDDAYELGVNDGKVFLARSLLARFFGIQFEADDEER